MEFNVYEIEIIIEALNTSLEKYPNWTEAKDVIEKIKRNQKGE